MNVVTATRYIKKNIKSKRLDYIKERYKYYKGREERLEST